VFGSFVQKLALLKRFLQFALVKLLGFLEFRLQRSRLSLEYSNGFLELTELDLGALSFRAKRDDVGDEYLRFFSEVFKLGIALSLHGLQRFGVFPGELVSLCGDLADSLLGGLGQLLNESFAHFLSNQPRTEARENAGPEGNQHRL